MKYVYILQCVAEPDRYYVGIADDLKTRLSDHNAGRSPHTSKHRPWRINTYLAFSDPERATAFERYLKSHSRPRFRKEATLSRRPARLG
jgi:predicted GIY-YIG superfamily endonuclease